MGVRAVIVVSDESGLRRRFWAAWASRHYQIPHLARLVHTADHNSVAPAGWPSQQDWQREAHTFTTWLSDTDPPLLHRVIEPADPAAAPVPQWYAVSTAREQARRIGTQLREQYPGVQIRTRV